MYKAFAIGVAAWALLAMGMAGTAVAYEPPPPPNQPPTAYAGVDQNLTQIGVYRTLNGYGYDAEDSYWMLNFRWNAVSAPAGCNSSCLPENPYSSYTRFFVLAYGTYTFRFQVCDSDGACASDFVTYSFVNLPPQADAGAPISAVVGDLVTLDGSGSSDPNGDALTYAWTLTARPEGSAAVLYDGTTATPQLSPDVPGTYVASLTVSDGQLASQPATVQIEVVSVLSAATSIIMQAVDLVNGLGEADVKNLKMQKAYANKVNALLHKVEDGDYLDAMIKLQDDLQAKANGCRTSSPPMPDPNDWILSCDAQAELTDLGIQLYEFLESRVP